MPQITVNRKVFEKLVGKSLPDDKLKDRISFLGTDLDEVTKDEIKVEIFPDRPDMLSEQGFARAFSSFIGAKTGLRKFEVKKSGSFTKVENSLKIWPYVVTCIVKGLTFNDEKIREVIQIQEKLGVSLCRNRKKGGIGIYPLDKIKLPIRFTTMDADKIKFRPLEYPTEITGRQILTKHPTGRTYGHIIEDEKEFPIFLDANNTLMSMPPIINSHDVGKITEKTKDIFVEATGPELSTLITALNILVTAFSDMGGKVYSMDIIYKNKKITTPDLTPKKMKVNMRYINKLLGLDLKEKDFKKYLERMGYGYEKGIVLVPAYRTDILHQADLAEDVAIAYGYENFEETIPNVATIGEADRFEVFKERILNTLTGLGYIETNTFCIINKDDQTRKMNFSSDVIELLSCVSEEYDSLRTWMIPSLLHVLNENKHHEYPQNIFEAGRVFSKDKSTETGVKEAVRFGVLLCGPDADYTKIRQVLDVISDSLDLKYEIEAVEHHSFIEGRVGRVKINGKGIAYIGELNPEVLENFDIEMPTAGLELNLTDLFEILR